MVYGVMSKSSTLTAQNILTKPSHRQQILRSFSNRFSSCAALNAFPSFAASLDLLLPSRSFPQHVHHLQWALTLLLPNTHAVYQHQWWASHRNFLHDSWSNMRPLKRLEQNTDHNFQKAFTRSQCLASQLFCMCCFWCFPASDFCIILILRTHRRNSVINVMYLILLFDIISFVWTLSLSHVSSLH